ncbi:MAG: TIGR03986 family CRISPR-associated RAMP protein [Hyphomicrobiales bacterium]|nr:TIGR03986 family CRISPR-associated RAMP protein [Hyphomicrobiales bacterium]
MIQPWYNEFEDIICNYRFISLNEQILPWKLEENGPSHDKPVAGGYCGTISMEWLAATPVLIGKGDDFVNPKRLRDDDPNSPFILPGKTLRGMIRAVMRIGTWSALGPINDKTAHWRNPEYQQHKYSNDLKSAWLSFEPENNRWRLTLCRSEKLTSRELGGSGDLGYNDGDNSDHKNLAWIHADANRKLMANPVAANGTRFGNAGGFVNQHLVLSGAFGTRKNHQHVFYPLNDREKILAASQSVLLPKAFIKPFFDAHSAYSSRALRPDSNLAPWLEDYAVMINQREAIEKSSGLILNPEHRRIREWDTPPGIPVWCAFKDNRKAVAAIGMTQMMRVPADYSVRQVANRSQVPPSDQQGILLDWDRALFGYVDEDGDNSEAFRGRIKFGFASASSDAPVYPAGNQYIRITQMEPRLGYFPTYLHHVSGWGEDAARDWCDFGYDSKKSIINGRKRYPVKEFAYPFDNPVFRVTEGGNLTATQTALKFIDRGAIFSGSIKFHNLHRLELGALLWVLSLGDEGAFSPEGGKHHHSAGRLKAFWYGQLKPRNLRLRRLIKLPSEEAPTRQVLDDGEFSQQDCQDCIANFKAHMGEAMIGAYLDGDTQNLSREEHITCFDNAVRNLLLFTNSKAEKGVGGLKEPSLKRNFRPFNDYSEFRTRKAKGYPRWPDSGQNALHFGVEPDIDEPGQI